MGKINDLFKQYENCEFDEMGSRKLKMMRKELLDINPCDIYNLSDSENYINLLQLYRKAVADRSELEGKNYPELVRSLLSVGENGLYSDDLRFIFELIQNVDDCEYASFDDCKLQIHFDDSKGEITLIYNEEGFSPNNVFAITGIGEAAKNIKDGKFEIGEKGIGFKSVFGVADKVLIQSGLFSFEIDKEDFTVPKPVYEGFEKVEGTRMTLYMSPKLVGEIYRKLVDRYKNGISLFNKNPLLFLNKLTNIKFYIDNWRCIDFYVERLSNSFSNGLNVEDKVNIRLELNNSYKGNDLNIKESIDCIRYSKNILYDYEACKSRYGEETEVGKNHGKNMRLQIVVPKPDYVEKIKSGTLYSFLPTQISLNVPIAIHVPFKLDASREFIDPNKHNIPNVYSKWFEDSCKGLVEILSEVYSDLAVKLKEKIVYYLPGKDLSIFKNDNGKINCLYNQAVFKGSNYLRLPVFTAYDGTLNKSSDVMSVVCENEYIEKIYKLLSWKKKLFVPPVGVNVSKFGIEINKDVDKEIFRTMIDCPEKTQTCLEYLLKKNKTFSFQSEIPFLQIINLSQKQIEIFFRYPHIVKIFNDCSAGRMKHQLLPNFIVNCNDSIDIIDYLRENIDKDFNIDSLDDCTKYLEEIGYKCIIVKGKTNFFMGKNVLVLSGNGIDDIIDAFASFILKINSNSIAYANLKIMVESKRLNSTENDSSITDDEYLKKLRRIRESVKVALGDRAYSNYIHLIEDAGSNTSRFINELIQNADDCDYPESEVPEFTLIYDGKAKKLVTSYNEVGFSRNNVRAITAIGESTKKKLLKGATDIGEKGVGFKTVFAVASSVDIDSRDFHFQLTDQKPTIPSILKDREYVKGTSMSFDLKTKVDFSRMGKREILRLCLCLRKLKQLNINNFKVEIIDEDDKRIVKVNEVEYKFIKYRYTFDVDDKELLNKRSKNGQRISSKQEIYCYTPQNISQNTSHKYMLYSGLPTDISLNIPMAIDAPLELTTSRERPLENEWNKFVRSEVYSAIITFILINRERLRSKVLSYINYKDVGSFGKHEYVVNVFEDNFFNSYNLSDKLKNINFLPTLDENKYATPKDLVKRYPQFMDDILKSNEDIGVPENKILDIPNDSHNVTLNALDCFEESFSNVLQLFEKYIEKYMKKYKFSTGFYSYLKEANDKRKIFYADKERLRRMNIIPVYPKDGKEVMFVSWNDNEIFVEDNVLHSNDSYYVLNTERLSKADCESYLGIDINKMDDTYKRTQYQENLEYKINQQQCYLSKLYNYIINEFNNGNIMKFNAMKVLLSKRHEGRLPLKNRLGEITTRELFVNNEQEGYFASDVVEAMSVSDECKRIACNAGCRNLSNITYNDIPDEYKIDLTADDIESFNDDYFEYGKDILKKYMEDGYISDSLVDEYKLSYLIGNSGVKDEYGDIPNEKVKNIFTLRNLIKKSFNDPYTIKSVPVVKYEKKVVYHGKEYNIESKDIREGTIERYSADNGRCVCQICKKIKDIRNIEVNNIELSPKYYFPQMRVSLCLECSAWFKDLRNNTQEYDKFLEAVKEADVNSDEPVTIDIGNREITFTQTHLAEIQEIFKNMK